MGKRSNTLGEPSTPQKRVKTDEQGPSRQTRLDEFLRLSTSTNDDPVNRAHTPEYIDVDALEESVGEKQTSPPSMDAQPSRPSTSPVKVVTFGMKSSASIPVEYRPLDVHPALYSPESQPWPIDAAPYSFLAHTLSTLSQTKSRIAIMNALVNTMVTLIVRHSPSLLPALYLLSNTLAPPYVSIELGIGNSVLSKAIQQVSGLPAAALRKLYTTTGDLGDVAYAAKSKVRTLIPHAPLTIQGVYDSLLKIAHCKGPGASQQKESIVQKLLVAGTGEEIRYLVRTLSQNLRVGAVRTSLLSALARAFSLHPSGQAAGQDSSLLISPLLLEKVSRSFGGKKARDMTCQGELRECFARSEQVVKEVYARHPSYPDIVQALLCDGLPCLVERVTLVVGIPLLPALGSPVRSFDAMYDQLGGAAFVAEFKYDGQRAQIHVSRRDREEVSVKIFSRHLEDMTSKYPDVVGLMKEMLDGATGATSFILDSEIVAIDQSTGDLKSFQELSNRSRKDVRLSDIKITVGVFAFDLLYYNYESLLCQPFRERRRQLRAHFQQHTPNNSSFARFGLAESFESTFGREALMEFWTKAVTSRCEGLMIKVLDSVVEEARGSAAPGRRTKKTLPATYEPDKRTSAWLKLKKDYIQGVGDSIDMIPIGAWYGNGRKVGWWSPILLALWDPSTGKPVAICKCMSGFTDAFYKELSDMYLLGSENCSNQAVWECELGGFRPDVYFRPRDVWEIRGADITESPVSTTAQGMVPGGRGLSLRFPRFIQRRTDKSIEQASTPAFIVNIWRQQTGRASVNSVDDGDLLDPSSENDFELDGADLSG